MSNAALNVLTLAGLFVGAFVVSRGSAFVARQLLAWHDERHRDPAAGLADKFGRIKRRETNVAVIRAGIAYAGFSAAAVLSVARLTGGFDRLTTLAGASFALIVIGFAVQRVLTDILAGFAMFVERWYSVGDTVKIPGLELEGVVEDVSLRRTRLRTVNGEEIYIHNSQIPAVQVLRSAVKQLAVELFVSDRRAGEELVLAVSALVPSSPTTFVRRPEIKQIEELSDRLVRIGLEVSVAPGREWLAENFLADLLKEKAAPGLIVHGPVVLAVDEWATRSFARAAAGSRSTHVPAAAG